jgi:catalase
MREKWASPATKQKQKPTNTQAKRGEGSQAKRGKGGELHQSSSVALTSNQGTPLSDGQNSLKAGARGPTLLEDFALREKITHFDHERIPERIVHARGSAAHGYFQPYANAKKYTRAAFLHDPNDRTPVFVRFSTVAGGAGSVDLPRDVRGFAVKFYTSEGIFDLVGNNIPVFFIQDAMKFPDLIHSVKMEPDRGFPQAASAHDTFWDFVSLMPESMHMIMWAMSDRALPRSYRMMEGFGIHTFRFVDEKGISTFVKFHWRPKAGTQSVLWDEAVKINGADNDFHRRDLFEAIARGDFPEYELSVQAFSEKTAAGFDFDILDPTKLIPEEVVPLEPIGKMVLNRNPDNFFAETEQVAFHPGHVVPGIDFTDDPLLQGRLFSYTDTQLSRLGGPNFHELPINRPKCPMHNFQRDGISRMDVNKGRVSYEPNSLSADGPRALPTGFKTTPKSDIGPKVRERPETFADHYSQARLFYRSMTRPEQRHMENALAFELGMVETQAIRLRVLGHLQLVAPALASAVSNKLGISDAPEKIIPAREPIDIALSPSLSILDKAKPTLAGRKLGLLLTDGASAEVLASFRHTAKREGAVVTLIAARVGGVVLDSGDRVPADHALNAAPSVLFDAVALMASERGAATLDRTAVAWVSDAFAHLKVIGFSSPARKILDDAQVVDDEGIVALDAKRDVSRFFEAAKAGRRWEREEA